VSQFPVVLVAEAYLLGKKSPPPPWWIWADIVLGVKICKGGREQEVKCDTQEKGRKTRGELKFEG
jgi:hypothetical protein